MSLSPMSLFSGITQDAKELLENKFKSKSPLLPEHNFNLITKALWGIFFGVRLELIVIWHYQKFWEY